MSHVATPETGPKRLAVPVPTPVPGTTWFGLMAATWSAFFTLLAASPGTLADAYDWLTGLAIVWEIVMWIVLFPWAITYVVWESSWEEWVRVLVVVLFATVHLSICLPRANR